LKRLVTVGFSHRNKYLEREIEILGPRSNISEIFY